MEKLKAVPGALNKDDLKAAWAVLQRLGLELSFVEFRSIWMRAMAAGRRGLRDLRAPIPDDDAALYTLLVDLAGRVD